VLPEVKHRSSRYIVARELRGFQAADGLGRRPSPS
jgi:hypothetical protein